MGGEIQGRPGAPRPPLQNKVLIKVAGAARRAGGMQGCREGGTWQPPRARPRRSPRRLPGPAPGGGCGGTPELLSRPAWSCLPALQPACTCAYAHISLSHMDAAVGGLLLELQHPPRRQRDADPRLSHIPRRPPALPALQQRGSVPAGCSDCATPVSQHCSHRP